MTWIPRDFRPGAALVTVEAVLIGISWLASSQRAHTIATAAVLVSLLIGVMALAMIIGAINRGGNR